jgi:hypothetical protein
MLLRISFICDHFLVSDHTKLCCNLIILLCISGVIDDIHSPAVGGSPKASRIDGISLNFSLIMPDINWIMS